MGATDFLVIEWESVCLQECVFQDEEYCEDDGANVQLLVLSATDVKQHPTDESHQYTVRDGVGERHESYADKAWNGCDILAEIHLANVVHHHYAYKDKGWSRSLCRNREEERCKEKGKKEADGCDESCKSAASTYIYARSALHVCGDSRSTEDSTECGSDGISHESVLEVRDITFLVHHSGTVADTDEGADSVEHIDEEECQYADYHIHAEHVVPFKLAEDRLDAWWHIHYGREMSHSERYACYGGDKDSDKESTSDIAHQQHSAKQYAEAS